MLFCPFLFFIPSLSPQGTKHLLGIYNRCAFLVSSRSFSQSVCILLNGFLLNFVVVVVGSYTETRRHVPIVKIAGRKQSLYIKTHAPVERNVRYNCFCQSEKHFGHTL